MRKITYTEAQARKIQSWGEQNPRISNAEMKRWRAKWHAERLNVGTDAPDAFDCFISKCDVPQD